MMGRQRSAWCLAVVLGACAGASRADTLELSSTFSGGIHAGGATAPGFMNYYVGYSVPSTPVERRNYFIFDLTGLHAGDGLVVSATLKLFLPGGPSMPLGFISSEPTEDYRVSGSGFHWTAFASAFGGTATPPMLDAMFGTMGTGAAYGLTTISSDHGGTDVEIALSGAAIAAINASLGDHFLVTGRLPDIHPGTPGTPPSELVFAYTDIPHPLMPMPRLEVVRVPGPAGGIVIAAAGGWLCMRRKRVAA